MTGEGKRTGSPLEGGPTKFFIVGLANHRVPSPRVAHLQELTNTTKGPESLRGACTPAEGIFFRYCCFPTPNEMFPDLQMLQWPAHS